MNPNTDEEIDHINRNKLDNRKSNLRICNRSINMQNRGVNKNNTSGYKGIYINKSGKYVAHCQINKTRKSLGAYKTLEEALEVLNKFKEENRIG